MWSHKNVKNVAALFAVMFALLSIFSAAASAESISNISPGLRALTVSKYAKVYTLENKRYYELYSNTALTARISDTAWTGESDEIWITGVGVNNNGIAYARIRYPVGSRRVTAYMNLRDTFVPGTLTGDARTAVKSYYGLSSRRASAANRSYGIDPGDRCYLLTLDNGWCQVLYPTSTSQWRIAWMTVSAYYATFYPDGDDGGNDDGDDGDARQAVVAHAESILNYTWSSSKPILLYYNGYYPYISGGELQFSRAPVIAKGIIRGIPYTLSSNNTGGGQEKTFSQYKALSAADKAALSNIYTYGSNRISMKYGMSCATFVTDCILQGLTGAGLSSYPVTDIHNQSGWRNYITQGSRTTAGYKKLQKGDYLYTSGHVRLVTANSGTSITVIEQAPPDYTRINCSNKKTVTVTMTYNGSTRSYSSTQVCMSCNACKKGTTGTKRASYSYTNLMNNGYYPMYVSYPSQKSSPNTWQDSSMSIVYSLKKGYTGSSYSDWVKVTGGTSPYKASISSGSLPDGLSLSVLNTNRIYLKGTPTKTGTFNFTLRVTGSHNGYAEKALKITISSLRYYRASNEDELLDESEREELARKALEDTENRGDVVLDAADLALISGYAAGSDSEELLFELGQWKDAAGESLNVTSQKVYFGGKLTDAKIDDDGCFKLKPSDMAADDNKDATVYVTAEADGLILKSKEVSISGDDENQLSKANGQSGCDTGAGCAALLFLIVYSRVLFSNKKIFKI